MSSFSLMKDLNVSLTEDVIGQINGSDITLTLPSSAQVVGLKASFISSPGSTVVVNGHVQESGVSANDFSNPVTYKVTAEDGSSSNYVVTVSILKASDKELLSFAFLKVHNASLAEDVPVPVIASKNNYLVTIPNEANIWALKATFKTAETARVTVNNAPQISGVTSNDFSKSLVYKVTAEDGTFKEYYMEASKQADIPTIENAVKVFISKYDIPGISLAITKDERLVYSKGYGFAEMERIVPVTAESMFRLASLSKPITAIAVLKLVDSGKLTLDQKVFGPSGILGTTYGKQPYSPQLLQITVRHVLNHTAGGDAWNHLWNFPTRIDPFYQQEWLNYSNEQVISAVLDTRPVIEPPGIKMIYSNVGYNIAGRIIEKISGMKYEKYVQENLLKPLGISPETMRIGGTKLSERYPNEVVYYNSYPGYDQPYDFPVPRMDAHAGWISTSINLARLLSSVDGMPAKRDILSSASWKAMITPSQVSVPPGGYAGYGLGWFASVNGAYWHRGGMAGTATYWMKIGTYTFTILINTRSAEGDFYADIDKLCYQMTLNLTLTGFMKGDQFDLFFK
ncbi:CubicO group peptidase, beta-lactamase class C family [Dyadobacter sp. SG02]|nr:CubicO group peptidase, beta-lactamase class C family [Dyadobacter sp. SG02]